MKTAISFSVVTCVLFAIACTKENIKPSVSATSQSSQIAEHFIGEHFGGGIIFYLDKTKQHGLIAATADPEEPSVWSYFDTVTGARGIKISSGFQNTRKIVAVQGDPGADAEGYAALETTAFEMNGYKDWLLPSKAELNELYKQKNIVGGFSPYAYWSSTEVDASTAWFQNFRDGSQYTGQKIGGYAIRPIRYF
jgi:hypothetical protein